MADALGRADVGISRGTLGNWVIRASELHLHRVYDALQQKLRAQPLVHGDETWVQVLKEEGRDAQAKSFMWAYRSGQDCAQPVVLFDYQPGRAQEYPQAFLAGYRGLLMSDGYDAWRTLTGTIHLGCMAHARRKFTDALKARKTPGGPPLQALKFFEALYEVERVARQTLPDGETRAAYSLRLRQQHSLPVLAAFKTWLDDQAPKVLPESLTGKAIAYARNQWDYLTRYTSDVSPRSTTMFWSATSGVLHRKKKLAVQRHRCRRQGKRRDLQFGADMPGMRRRSLCMATSRAH
ncbi:hypothetical protein ABIA06_003459 [Bradyrhizobium yuanmingense]